MDMRQLLGTTLLAFTLLGGCGDDSGSDMGPTAETHPITLVSGTAGGGEPEPQATDVTGDAALASYVEQFDDSLAGEVTSAAGKVDVTDGEALLAQVVSVGCDVPPSAHLRGDVIVPAKVAKPMMECLAPVTTVGLAVVAA
jgi:hypothetical protein